MKKWDTLQDSLKIMAHLYKDVYFLAMMNQQQTTQSFRDSQHKFLDVVIDKLATKYEDHIEGTRGVYNEILGSKHQNS